MKRTKLLSRIAAMLFFTIPVSVLHGQQTALFLGAGINGTLEELLRLYPTYKIDVYYDEMGCYTYASVDSMLEEYGVNWYSAYNDWAIFTPMDYEGEEAGIGYFLLLENLDNREKYQEETTIWKIHCRASPIGRLTVSELPFELLPPSLFDKEAFDDDADYWRTDFFLYENGDLVIKALPAMSYVCVMFARCGNDGYTLFRRAIFDYMNVEIAPDNDATEQYIQNTVRPNYQRINAIERWAHVEEKENYYYSLEGAWFKYYYSDDGLEKITAEIYGETYENHIEYYFLDGRLSFIHDITTQYDGAKYDADPDEIISTSTTERRWYMNGNSCIRGIGDNGKKLTQEEIENEFLDNDGITGAFWLYKSIIEL